MEGGSAGGGPATSWQMGGAVGTQAVQSFLSSTDVRRLVLLEKERNTGSKA